MEDAVTVSSSANTDTPTSWREVRLIEGVAFRWGPCPGGFVGEWKGVLRVTVDTAGNILKVTTERGADERAVRKLTEGAARAFARSVVGKLSLHASAVACAAGAVLCLGPGGAGKSTAAAILCRRDGVELLSDDTAAIEPANGTWYALPTESSHWLLSEEGAGKPKDLVAPRRRGQRSAPLRCVVSLSFHEAGPGITVRRRCGSEAFRALMTSAARLILSPDARRQELDLLASLCDQIPVIELTRSTSVCAEPVAESVWELLHERAEAMS
jgi:hypothetical protein